MLTVDSHSVSETLAGDGTALALHSWAPSAPVTVRGVLYYVHGIQSHAGWLFETGPELASRGVATFVLDRRGSGRSGGMRGDLPSARVVMDDYLDGLRAVRRALPDTPLTVLGQSFGASIVAALAADGGFDASLGGVDPDRLVYCTPALGQQRARHGEERMRRILATTGLGYLPIALEDEDYTDQPRYLEFMANDGLMLRQSTERSRATMVELEQTYLGRCAATDAPAHFVRVERDPIIALDEAQRVLTELHPRFDTVTFQARHHYVEFSPARRDYWDWLAGVVTGLAAEEIAGRES